MGTDVGAYLITKLLRGDFWYWVPVGGHGEIVTSALARIGVKIITDFTSLVQFRHPQEMGGVSFLFSLVVAIVSLPVAIKTNERMGNDKAAIDLAWKIVEIVIPTVLLSLTVFFTTIEKKYRETFYSSQTGKGMNQENFKNEKNDLTKAYIFSISRHYWVGLEDDIKLWVQENWS